MEDRSPAHDGVVDVEEGGGDGIERYVERVLDLGCRG
jgi:hypothetical protein